MIMNISKMIIGALFMLGIALQAESMKLESFDDADHQNEAGGWWYSYDDHNAGGNSNVEPQNTDFRISKDGKNPALKVIGTAGNKLGWDYFGVGTNLSEKSGCPDRKPVDISVYKKLKFKMKGKMKGGRLTVNIPYHS